MGRHAGWLAGAASLAKIAGCGPDLIYLPEVDFNMEEFLADVSEIYAKNNNCIVAVSEGIHYPDGTLSPRQKLPLPTALATPSWAAWRRS